MTISILISVVNASQYCLLLLISPSFSSLLYQFSIFVDCTNAALIVSFWSYYWIICSFDIICLLTFIIVNRSHQNIQLYNLVCLNFIKVLLSSNQSGKCIPPKKLFYFFVVAILFFKGTYPPISPISLGDFAIKASIRISSQPCLITR